MLVKDADEAIIVGRLHDVHHFMDNHILQQVPGLLYELRIEPNVSSPMIAAAPLGLHPLQEVTRDDYFELWLPLPNEPGHHVVKK